MGFPEEAVDFVLWAVPLTALECVAAVVALRSLHRPWLAVPLLWRLPWSAMQLFGVWYCVLTGSYYLGTFGFPLSWWTFGLQLELLFLLPFLAALLMVAHRPRCAVGLAARLSAWMRSSAGRTAMWGLWSVGLVAYAAAVRYRGVYGEASAQILLSPGSQQLAASNLLTPFADLFWPASAALLAARTRTGGQTLFGRARLLRLLVDTAMVLVCADAILHGQRTAFLAPLAMLGLAYGLAKQEIKRVVLPLAAVGALGLVSASLVADFRADREALAGDRTAALESLAALASQQVAHPLPYLQRTVEAFVSRADWYMNGALLARYADARGLAGLKPYEGLLYVWLPRSIVPDKPVIGSEDGSALGLPAYILGLIRSSGAYTLGASASRSVAGEAYWQFGAVGVLAVGGLAGLWTALWARACLGGRQALGLALYVYVNPGGTPVHIIHDQLLRRCLYLAALGMLFSLRTRAARGGHALDRRAGRAAGRRAVPVQIGDPTDGA